MIKSAYRHIHLERLREDTFGDQDILITIIELFINDVYEYVAVLNAEMPNKNWSVLFQATHKIKPNITMFGISELEDRILQLERNFRNEQNLEQVSVHVDFCLNVLSKVIIELQTELKLISHE